MEELVQRQLRQRELDIPTTDYSGSLVPSYVPDISTTLTAQNSSEKLLSIHPENVQINVLDISQSLPVTKSHSELVEGYASQNPSYKKKVVFDLSTSESKSESQPLTDQLFNKMNQLEKKIDKLMNMQAEMQAKLEFRCHIPKDDVGVQRNMVSAYIVGKPEEIAEGFTKDDIKVFRNINKLFAEDAVVFGETRVVDASEESGL
jgi:hypothetical protein